MLCVVKEALPSGRQWTHQCPFKVKQLFVWQRCCCVWMNQAGRTVHAAMLPPTHRFKHKRIPRKWGDLGEGRSGDFQKQISAKSSPKPTDKNSKRKQSLGSRCSGRQQHLASQPSHSQGLSTQSAGVPTRHVLLCTARQGKTGRGRGDRAERPGSITTTSRSAQAWLRKILNPTATSDTPCVPLCLCPPLPVSPL